MSNYLKGWMVINGISKGRVAREAGVDPTHMGRIVEGRYNLTLDVARKIAYAFGSDIDAQKLYQDISSYTPEDEGLKKALGQAAAEYDSQGW